MASVEFKNVWKLYGKTRAVQGVSFKVEDNTLTAILGPSGAGKSSMLKMIAGIEGITHGDILFDGQSIKNFEPEELDVAMIFESYALYPQFTVFENIAFPLKAPTRVKKYSESEIKDKVEAVARTLQIDMLLDRKPKELSGGQKQRVAMGRALVRNPRVLLMDEPIAHLDAKLRNKMRGEIRSLIHSLDTTIFYVTHDYREALAIADNVIALNKGVIQQISSSHDIFNKPETDFVADLVGDPPMNIIDCKAIEKNGEMVLHYGDIEFKLDAEKQAKVRNWNIESDHVRLGVRPIHVKFNDEDSINWIQAEVYVLEPLGRINIITLRLDKKTLIQAVVPYDIRPQIGESIKVYLSNIHVFKPSNDYQSTMVVE